MNRCVIGFVTCSARAEARKLAAAVLEAKAAACVNILSGVESHYWWQGKLAEGREWLLVIKTTANKTKEVMRIIQANHSYEVPEIIFTPVAAGERNYLKWLRQSVAVLAILCASFAVSRADQVDELIKQLGSGSDETRGEAASKLAELGGPRAEQQFRKMIASDNPERRQTGVVGLLQLSDAPEDLARVRSRLKDESQNVRWSAALALGQSGRSEAIAWLQEVAKNDAAESVREAAQEAVAKLSAGVRWVRSVALALKQAKELSEPVLAYFFVRGELCEQFDEGVLADQEVVDATHKFACVRLDAAKLADEARKFDVRGAPTVLILDAKANELARLPGLVSKEKLLAKLTEARDGKLTFAQARRQAAQDAKNVSANWKVAETYLDEGREDLAEPLLRNVIAHDEENRYGYTDNAVFALAFMLGKRGQYAQSAYGFAQLLVKWPNYKDKDKALYCLGLSQLALGQKDKGRATLEQLCREFPNSGAAPSARQALEKLGVK